MSDFIHKFLDRDSFTDMYYGSTYTEPWTSLTGSMVTEFTPTGYRQTLEDEIQEAPEEEQVPCKLLEIRTQNGSELYVWGWERYDNVWVPQFTTTTCDFSENDEIEVEPIPHQMMPTA